MEGVLPRPDIAPIMRENFVALAADADDTEPGVVTLARRLEDAMMLPFVLFADAEGGFLDGFSGVASPPYLLKTLNALVASTGETKGDS